MSDIVRPRGQRATSAGAGAGTKGDRTRQRILDAAAGEITRNGPEGTSLRSVADAAGLKTGSLYFHFSSKEQLVAAVLEEGIRESALRLEEAITSVGRPDDAAAVLGAAIGAHLRALRDLEDYAVAILAPNFLGDASRSPVFRSLRSAYLQRWSEVIEAAQRAGVVADGLPSRTARDMIIGALNGTSLRRTSPQRATAAIMVLLGGPAGQERAT